MGQLAGGRLTWTDTFTRTAEHYAAMAMTRGCWQYAQAQVIAMEADPEYGQHWQGLRAAVGRRIKAANFRPHPSDLAAFEREPQPLPSARRWRGG